MSKVSKVSKVSTKTRGGLELKKVWGLLVDQLEVN